MSTQKIVNALRIKIKKSSVVASISAFFTTTFILTVARLKAPFPILLADRFLPGSGWVEILLLASYSAFINMKLSISRNSSLLRLRIWLVFSIVFFMQFIIGIAGVEKLLMTGRLHVPVPAVVIAGPVYRGERFFMPVLFLFTIILVGPAWCSYLCYIGSWDGLAASVCKKATDLSPVWVWLRLALFIATPLAALLLRMLRVKSSYAVLAAVVFGLFGAGIMVMVSTRKGVMVYCTSICPLGLTGNYLGKISPFRIRIGERCNECQRCIYVCRYNALDQRRITMRRPALTCTLCGDCISSCKEDALSYSFPGLSPKAARLIFLTLVTALHAVFIGVARI